MKEIKTSDIDTISQSNKVSETFDPDKRIEVKERPINGNFTESDKYNELLCQHKKIHRFKVYKLYSLFVFQFIALEGFIHFIRYTVI